MTTTIKDSVGANNLGKQGTQSKDSAGKTQEGARSNPVCLELNITIRSLPTESGASTKPIRVEGRTVIVFDNGAVLRCTENLPVGQTFILSNPNGRDVVCLVAAGRNLPSVKGYVEVQFIEPVNDFWGIHEAAPAPVVAKAPEVRREVTQPSATPVPVPATPQSEAPLKPANTQVGNVPSCDDPGGILSLPTTATAERRGAPAPPPSERTASSASAYSQSGNATPGLVANLASPGIEQAEEKHAKRAVTEALSNALSSGPISGSNTVSSANVFSSKGMLAHSQSEPKATALGGRMPMIVGAIALVLAGVGAGAFIMHKSSDPVAVAATAAVSQPPAVQPSAAANTPEVNTVPTQDKGQSPAQNVAVEQSQSQAGTSVSAIPAVVSNPVFDDTKLDQKETKRAESAASSRSQSASSAPRRPSIANLKMSSPSAPRRNAADLGAGAAPLTDMVATQPVVTSPSLLTSSGRTSTQPAPPPGTIPSAPVPAAVQALAGKTVAPKLISSTRLTYPASAKQTGIQGTVTVIANVDANGAVSNVRALNGPLLLRQAAVDSVKQWKYSPELADGQPTAAQVTVAVEFKLN